MIFPSWKELTDTSSTLAHWGTLGDYFGGLWGTIVSLLGLFWVIRTFNLSVKEARSRKTTEISILMVETHQEIVNGMKFKKEEGQDVFAVMLKEFTAGYRIAKAENSKLRYGWSTRDLIDIGFTYMMFGATTAGSSELKKYGWDKLKQINDDISRLKETPRYQGCFVGHQNRLSHYYRNLFNLFEYLSLAKVPRSEKDQIGKVVRSRLSNYEQALLALNAISHLGKEWENRGYLTRYQLVKNIPEKFFTFDEEFDLKEMFSEINFEFSKNKGIQNTLIWAKEKVMGNYHVIVIVANNKDKKKA